MTVSKLETIWVVLIYPTRLSIDPALCMTEYLQIHQNW